jgi:hypothetical protein
MSNAMEHITTIAIAIIGVAILALLVSKKANTSGVIQSAGQAFSTALAVAESPVTGTSVSINLGGGLGGNGFTSPF